MAGLFFCFIKNYINTGNQNLDYSLIWPSMPAWSALQAAPAAPQRAGQARRAAQCRAVPYFTEASALFSVALGRITASSLATSGW